MKIGADGALAIGLLAIGLGAVSGCAPARSQDQPPPGLVWMALNEINAVYFDRDDPTNRPPLVQTVPEGMLRPVDINGDGRSDWLVVFQASGLPQFCGTGGCVYRLYVSNGPNPTDGYHRVFDNQALAFEVREAGAGAASGGEGPHIEAWVHHLYCQADVERCNYAWTWDEGQRRLVETATDVGSTLLFAGGFPVIDPASDEPEDSLPPVLAERRGASRLTCDYRPDEAPIVVYSEFKTVPDVTGDDQRDWIEYPPSCPDAETRPGYTVWASAAGDTWSAAYRAGPGRSADIDIATRPARVIDRKS